MGFEKFRHCEVYLDVDVALVLISDALSIEPGFGQTASFFFFSILHPVKTKSFNEWILLSCEEA